MKKQGRGRGRGEKTDEKQWEEGPKGFRYFGSVKGKTEYPNYSQQC